MLTINSASNARILLQEAGADKGSITAGGSGLYIRNLAGRILFRNSSDADTMAIWDDGKVGIGTGTTGPTHKLEIKGAGSNTDVLNLHKGSGVGGLRFTFDGTNYVSYIRTYESGTLADNYMALGVSQGNTTAGADVMRLMGDGKVGINGGDVSLYSRLTVKDSLAITASAGIQHLLMGNQDSTGANNPVIFRVANGKLEIGGGDSWSSSTGGTFTPLLSIEDDGKVGIGTGTSVDTILHVQAAEPVLKIEATGASKTASLLISAGTAAAGADPYISFADGDATYGNWGMGID